jgi:DNA-directed RNA polymerase II subunit RPB1
VCKKTLGTSGGGLVHTTWIELGPDAARKLINNTQFTVNHWLLHVGLGGGAGLWGGARFWGTCSGTFRGF